MFDKHRTSGVIDWNNAAIASPEMRQCMVANGGFVSRRSTVSGETVYVSFFTTVSVDYDCAVSTIGGLFSIVRSR